MATEAGAGIVTVVALYDANNNFYPDGKTFAISTNSAVMGAKNLPITVSIPGAIGAVETADLLIVKTDEFGDLYLNMTIDEYTELLRLAGDSSGTPSLPFTQVAYGGEDDEMTSSEGFIYTPTIGVIIKARGNAVFGVGYGGDGDAARAELGDVDSAGNGTKITLDDDPSKKWVTITNVPEYANDAAAVVGGLPVGTLYKTTTAGSTVLKIVP